ncbi:MAG: hypothetical protein M1839_001661, partial [Geoglossum umbratile]
EALDMLLVFPGLWDGLELGNIKKHLALHCDEEVLHYLGHIYTTWNEITLGNLAIQQAVDIRTVRNLQSRAPSVSVIDRDYIINQMDNKTLFSTIVDDNLRELIKQALLQLRVIIPTIKSFHENLKYFGIGAKILKTHLLSEPLETTIYRTMFSQWSPPENILVEFQEGEFQHALLPEEEPPEWKQEAIQGIIDPAYSLLFLKRAQLLGFRTEKILRGLENTPENMAIPYAEPMSGLDSDGESIKRRWGRPFSNAYRQFRMQLFLPNLLQARVEVSQYPSVMFVQQDFLNAFFGPTSEITVTSASTVSVSVAQRFPARRDAVPPPIPVFSAQVPHETVVTPESEAPSRADVLFTPEAHESSVLTEQYSESLISPEFVASPEQAARETTLSPGMGDLLDQFSRTTMVLEGSGEIEYEEAQSQSNTLAHQARSFIDVNSTTSGVSGNTTQSDQLISEASTVISELDNGLLDNAENHVVSPITDNLEAETSQDHQSFLMPGSPDSPLWTTGTEGGSPTESLNSPPSAVGTDGGCSPESQSPPASQRLRSFLLPGLLGSPIIQGHQPFEAWNSRDHRSFLTPRPLSSLPQATSVKSSQLSPPSRASQSRQSFLMPDFQSRRSFLPLDSGSVSTVSQRHRSFLMPNPVPTRASQSRQLSPILHAVGNSRDRRSFLTPESRLTHRTSSITTSSVLLPNRFEFIEYNGMRKLLKSTQNMDQYLQQRKGWIGLVIRQRIAKTIRFDQMAKYMTNNDPSQNETYALVKAPYAERFRRNLVKVTRSAENNEDVLDFASSSSNKRLRN